MLSFLRKFRWKKQSDGKVRKYFFYALGEIILLVIGILLALEINNWNQARLNKKSELKYYQNIKRQLNEDVQGLNATIDFNNRFIDQFAYASQIIELNDRTKKDTLGSIAVNLTEFSDFHRKSNIYETLVGSGEVKLIENSSLIESLQTLEATYIYINRLELSHAEGIKELVVSDLRRALKFNTLEVKQPDLLYSYEFQNLFVLLSEHMREKDAIYHRALKQIQSIMEILDRELQNQ
ncbi:MAG: DUF6090 family protein [Marinifilaceae bacterium]